MLIMQEMQQQQKSSNRENIPDFCKSQQQRISGYLRVAIGSKSQPSKLFIKGPN